MPGYNKADYYFSLACANNVLINGTNYNVLFITARGTGSDNLVEQIGDFSSEVVPFEKGYYAYEDCKYFCDKIMNQIEGQAGYL